MRFTRVDLPEPEGPIMASHSPAATESETSSSARTSTLLLYTRATFLSSIDIILLAGSLRAVSVATILTEQWKRSTPTLRFPAIPETGASVAAGWQRQSLLCRSRKRYRSLGHTRPQIR